MLCGKILYKTQREAADSIRGGYADARRHKRTEKSKIYFCIDCQSWHTASNDDSVKLKKKRFTERPTTIRAFIQQETSQLFVLQDTFTHNIYHQMKRKIKMVATSPDGDKKTMTISVDVTFAKGIMNYVRESHLRTINEDIHAVLRKSFSVTEIKIK